MKKLIYTILVIVILFSCEKKSTYSKELTKIYKAHGGAEAFKNVNTISFSVDDKDITLDVHSGKKVVSGHDFSFGFDGKNYWSTQKSPVTHPKEYVENLSQAMLIPFSLLDKKQTGFDDDKAMISFNETKIFYNPNTNLITVAKIGDTKISYQGWQEAIGFQLPKLLHINNKEYNVKNLQLSQAVFADRFYQKPN